MNKMNKKAAMEMSVGTIVTIVLLMSVLVLGLVLTKGIFTSATGAMKMTDDQLVKEINKIYGEETALGIYPTSRMIELKQGQAYVVGIVMKNLLAGVSENSQFTYTVYVNEEVKDNKCPLSDEQVMEFIKIGEGGTVSLEPGNSFVGRVRFEIPATAPFCTVRYSVSVEAVNGNSEPVTYPDSFDVEIVPK